MSDVSLREAWDQAYLSDGNMAYVDSLYEDYLLNPNSVTDEWREIFQRIQSEKGDAADVSHRQIREYFLQRAKSNAPVVNVVADQQMQVTELVNAYRRNGHLEANLDPLDMMTRPKLPELSLAYYNLDKGDRNKLFNSDLATFTGEKSLAEIYQALRDTYCGSIGVEYMHIANQEETEWFQNQLESKRGQPNFNATQKCEILKELIAADGLERYLGTKYVGQKRFSLEGGDALIPMMKELIRRGSSHELQEIVIGMAHRGRLNVLVNVLGKEPAQLFQEFEGKVKVERTGDVKYHLGFSADLRPLDKALVHVALAFNPSHLEIIGPVVQGSVRSRLQRRNDIKDKKTVLPIVIHGDAAFAGQGVVMETFNFSQARGYCTGGTVHIVINNQIGFTTSNPLDSRSTLYCTDVAKIAQAPVIHVNGDDPEAVVWATQVALDFRMKFKRDVVLDLVCYRRQGHNEADEPMVTQPQMYQKIKSLPAARELYAKKLIQEGVVTMDAVQTWVDGYRDQLDQGRAIVKTVPDEYSVKRAADWAPYLNAKWTDEATTSISKQTIELLSKKLLTFPENFTLHPVVKRLMQDREKMTLGELPINWGYAELMAYASLVHEGHEVRLSGQDCCRGTFAHRHAEVHDQITGERYVALNTIAQNATATFTVIDSVLSEEAVLAFEYGYSSNEPTSLVLWEAQFGDFANGAQVVVDQFISSGEQKWGRLCGLVMLLPHGYEGQGPEHSSARLERYMQLCAEQNIQVCNLTTPAQIFHILRRQVIRKFRKPLIIMTPKSLLRHKLAISTVEDLTHGEFKTVLPEVDKLDANAVNRVVLCSGKVYYDLLEKRRELKLTNVAIVRIEQLYPFPTDTLNDILRQYPKAKNIVWCQEEPQNQGVWFSSQHHIKECLESNQVLSYAGREFAAAPAVGSYQLHNAQQEDLINQALSNSNS
jgi:2-oxoglutarate dehydrogenase E1 component